MPDFVLKKRVYALKSAENKKNAASVEVDKCGVHLGSPCWARTSDIMINSHALYQLS